MNILLLGATGRTGKLVLMKALEAGHSVTSIVRNTGKISHHDKLKVVAGSPTQESTLSKAIQDCDAIISTLNISRNSDFPWSKLRTPPTLLSEVMTTLIPLAERHNVARLIVTSAWGVAETRKEVPGWFRWFIDNSNIGPAYQDHERQEELIMKSRLAWTIVRPAGLTNSKQNEAIIESYGGQPKPNLTISRLSVAKYLVNALTNDELIRKAPVLSKK